MEDLKIVSMNVNGLNLDAKRRSIFDHLRKEKADIALLQETHATSNSDKMWEKEWGGSAFFNNGSRSSRGVAILLNRNLSHKISKTNADSEGRILCLDIEIDGIIYTTASLYAPTQDKGKEQLAFVDRLDEFLVDSHSTNLILGGDLNHCMIPALDRSTQVHSPNADQMGLKLTNFTDEVMFGESETPQPKDTHFEEGRTLPGWIISGYPGTFQTLHGTQPSK